jgi:capsule polysaccharide modification protein KpsS
MDKYLQLNLNGYSYFVRRECLPSLRVSDDGEYFLFSLMAISDYAIDDENKFVKCRDDLTTILKTYLNHKPEYKMMDVQDEVHRCRQVQNPEKSNDGSSRQA